MMRYRGAWPTDRFRSLGPTNEPFCSQPFVDIFNDQTRAPPFCVSAERRRRACTYSSRASPVGEKNMFAPENSSPYLMRCNFFALHRRGTDRLLFQSRLLFFSPSNVQMRRHLICINSCNLKYLTIYANCLVT